MITTPAEYSCAICGETNSTFVDPSQGENQEYIEDCQICCNPNILQVQKFGDEFLISAIPE